MKAGMAKPRDEGPDSDLFRTAMRGVKPLDKAGPPPARATPAGRNPFTPRPAAPLPTAAPPPLAIGHAAGLDRARFERLKRGQMDIEARLDLHGLTQAEAHRELSAFIARAFAQGSRLALVITGKGREGKGVLRESVPRWLNEPGLRSRVLAVTQAQKRDGGEGSLYVLLRKLRP
jgi:DNA-nicking Smr family endonuclease